MKKLLLILPLILLVGCALAERDLQQIALNADAAEKIYKLNPNELNEAHAKHAKSMEKLYGSPEERLPADVPTLNEQANTNIELANSGWAWLGFILPLLIGLERVLKATTGESVFGLKKVFDIIRPLVLSKIPGVKKVYDASKKVKK
jgi:hypothetical protein